MQHRLTRRSLHLLLTLALALPLAVVVVQPWSRLRAAPAARPRAAFRYFPETGHNIGLPIKNFYDSHGGVPIFGLPLTELISQDGMQVQYFERARFELHPELPSPYYVSLTLLGSQLTEQRDERAFAPHTAENASPDRIFFPQTGHTLGGAFRAFWQASGQLPLFGYPISEEFLELNASDGKSYWVQYFERARFEYHTEYVGTPYEVQLGQFGSEYAGARGLAPELRAPARPIELLGTATVAYDSKTSTGKNMGLASARLDGLTIDPGQALSFNVAIGEISARSGYVPAPAIVDGIAQDDLGGGVCHVASALYRAVFAAGLAIEERHAHSRLLSYYVDSPGTDAAIYAPEKDLRWRNDTPFALTLVAEPSASTGRLTISLWGASDGRTTTIAGPTLLEQRKPTGTQRQALLIASSQRGLDVATIRVVRDATGQVIRRERIVSHYQPWEPIEIQAEVAAPAN